MIKYKRGTNPISLQNLKKGGSPKRRRLSPEEKLIKKEIKAYMREYLESGEAIDDFKKNREKRPETAT